MQNLKVAVIATVLLYFSNLANTAETCSRVAIINQQEVLIDTNSTQKGEGLRYFLEVDKISKEYLDRYQDGTRIKASSAAIGTIATGLILGGALSNSSGGNKRSLIVGGATLMAINFLIAKTLDYSNERNLHKAIDEYNKRNLPKIYFKPKSSDGRTPSSSSEFMIEKGWSF